MKPKLIFVAAVVATLGTGSAAASPYSGLMVFGDSLSDAGNLYAIMGGAFPPEPYWQGRISNGPIAAEYMAGAMGFTAGVTAFNFAVAGAKTGPNLAGGNDNYLVTKYGWGFLNGTGILAQAQTAAGTPASLDPNALYMVWGGPNDIFAASPTDLPATVSTAVGNLVGTVDTLYLAGARHFFVPLMPDLGLTPDVRAGGAGAAAAASGLTDGFNTALHDSLATVDDVQMPLGDIQFFDTAAFLRNAVAAPAAHGFSNVTDACVPDLTCIASNAAGYLFWDGVHPTTFAHQQLGLAFAAAVPEPESYAMFLAGLGVLAAVVRRRRRAT